MSSNSDASKASMANAKRIPRLATRQGGYYLDNLWALAEYALDEKVRQFAYAQAAQLREN